MTQITFTDKFALVHYEVARLENFNPEVVNQGDELSALEDLMNDYHESGSSTEDWTIVTKDDQGRIIDYYTQELFEMDTY